MASRRAARTGARKRGNSANRNARSNQGTNLDQEHALSSLLSWGDRGSGRLESCIARGTLHFRRGGPYRLLGLAGCRLLWVGLRLRRCRGLALVIGLGLNFVWTIR
jgi:hypothetical protein